MTPRSLLRSGISIAALALLALSGPPARAAQPDAALIAKGQYLATAGDCVACHTAPGGKPFAGGAALATPFGKIYPPNITPDKKTGIGDWSDDDFYRAIHEGVAKDGSYLYPAFPFPWYTKITRDDAVAIRAYLSSLTPVDAPDKPLGFSFPFNIRQSLLAWRLAFFRAGNFQPDSTKSPQWNRGAYLVEGLGHCGECHNRENLMGASDWSGRLQGGQINGWYAPALTSDGRQGVGSWSEADIVTYLKTGAAPGKGVVVGPMKQTIQDSLSHLTDDDLHAMAVYIKSVPAEAPDKDDKVVGMQSAHAPGEQAYLSHCAFCHLPSGQGQKGAIPALAGNGAVNAGGPEDVIRVVLGGLPATHGYAPMPAVGQGMSDQEIADVVNYVRQSWGNQAPATADVNQVGSLRAQTLTPMALNLAGGCKTPDDAALAKAVRQPAVVSELSDPSRPLEDRVDDILPKVKAAAPKAGGDEIVNAVMWAYCPVIIADTSKSEADRAADLGNFGGLVYGRLNRRPGRS
jgi:mono/diheme cytochrome c family protein